MVQFSYCTILYLFCWLTVFLYAQSPDDSLKIDPKITCSLEDGIIGRMTFDRPFAGKIYSSRYANVAQCIYFNDDHRDFVSFNIPVYSCGSIVEKDEQNRFLHLENEIYVQFDRQTQTIDDRRFLFVCDRRKKSSTNIHDDHIPDSNIVKDTLHPGQTVVVETIIPTALTANYQNTPAELYPTTTASSDRDGYSTPTVWMEIKDGRTNTLSSLEAVIRRPLKLGEPVVLVVSGKSKSRDPSTIDLIAHSCFATDGGGSIRINLTDSAGCTLRPSISLGAMTRAKNFKGVVSYMLPFKAFKFPASSDVYFSCSVDICSSCNFPEPCSQNPSRKARHLMDISQKQQQVYDSLRIYNPDDYSFVEDFLLAQNNRTRETPFTCREDNFLSIFLIIVIFVLSSIIIGAATMFILRRRKRLP